MGFVDENYKTILKADSYGSSESYHTVDIEVPEGAKYLLITTLVHSEEEMAKNKVILRGYKEVQAVNTSLRGKRVSILGDSISAYTGTIPSGNAQYYTGSNSGVSSANEMWWKVLCDKTGMEPLVINGWSGSCVTAGVRTDTTEASNASRCKALHNSNILPDVVLIAMGVNDYSYDAPLGTWNGKTTVGTDTSNFRAAYAKMIYDIQQSYPEAAIVCITPWFAQRGTDNGGTYVNGLGLTERAYADAIIEIAGITGCQVIDGQQMGFNRNNYYPTYCVDSSTNPTHPNAAGHRIMGNVIAEQLLSGVKGVAGLAYDDEEIRAEITEIKDDIAQLENEIIETQLKALQENVDKLMDVSGGWKLLNTLSLNLTEQTTVTINKTDNNEKYNLSDIFIVIETNSSTCAATGNIVMHTDKQSARQGLVRLGTSISGANKIWTMQSRMIGYAANGIRISYNLNGALSADSTTYNIYRAQKINSDYPYSFRSPAYQINKIDLGTYEAGDYKIFIFGKQV